MPTINSDEAEVKSPVCDMKSGTLLHDQLFVHMPLQSAMCVLTCECLEPVITSLDWIGEL